MKIKIAEEFDKEAAGFIAGKTLALPTGKTPIGMYLELKKIKFDWDKIKIFILDVNYPQNPSEP